MTIEKLSELNNEQKIQVCALWNNEYPEKLAFESVENFEKYLSNLTNLTHYLLFDSQNLSGWALTFEREKEKWFAIIISENNHGKGLGKQMLSELKKDNEILNGWVIDHNNDKKLNGNNYKSPIEFYQKNNFNIINEVRLELDTISAVKINWTKKSENSGCR